MYNILLSQVSLEAEMNDNEIDITSLMPTGPFRLLAMDIYENVSLLLT